MNTLPFTYNESTREIAKGGYGRVELVHVPERELYGSIMIATRSSLRQRKKRYQEIPVARKIYFRKNYFGAEIYNYRRMLPTLRKSFFPTVFRAYRYQQEVRFVHLLRDDGEEEVHTHTDIQYCMDMEYLDGDRWQSLTKLEKKDDGRVDRVFRQLVHLQLALIRGGGIYYDMSPNNVFVCKTSDRVKMVDYGGLFYPVDARELHRDYLVIRYRHQTFPDPLYCLEGATIANATLYTNSYFKGRMTEGLADSTSVIPALYALIVTIHMCVALLNQPRTDLLTAFVGQDVLNDPMVQSRWIDNLLTHQEIINDWTLLEPNNDGGGVEGGGEKASGICEEKGGGNEDAVPPVR